MLATLVTSSPLKPLVPALQNADFVACAGEREREEMSIPMIRASISRSLSLSLPFTLSSTDESFSRRKRQLSCAPSELNPVR